jgi:hypothetical protein
MAKVGAIRFFLELGLFCLASGKFAISQNVPGYDVSGIPDSVRKNAYAVIRNKTVHCRILNEKQFKISEKQVITILNKAGESKAALVIFYDKFRHIDVLKGNIYHGSGKLLRKITAGNMADAAAVSEYSLYDDNRIKYFQPLISEYPYTVEYEYEITFESLYYLSQWEAFPGYNIGAEYFEFSLSYPLWLKPSWYTLHLDQPLVTRQDSNDIARSFQNGKLQGFHAFLAGTRKMVPGYKCREIGPFPGHLPENSESYCSGYRYD